MGGGPSGTVLVVEDEPAIRLVCRVNLELDGFEVLEAASLGEARDRIGAVRIDVVLLDLHLGGERSDALVGECAARTPRLPVALLSGSTDVSAACGAGADAVLPKPFAIEQLTATVRTLVATGSRGG
jgi:DNA-binding response OmpR family regulator